MTRMLRSWLKCQSARTLTACVGGERQAGHRWGLHISCGGFKIGLLFSAVVISEQTDLENGLCAGLVSSRKASGKPSRGRGWVGLGWGGLSLCDISHVQSAAHGTPCERKHASVRNRTRKGVCQ